MNSLMDYLRKLKKLILREKRSFMVNKRYLFICTFGPVQSFIVKARKVIDYRNGSRLLSYFSDLLIDKFNEIIKNSSLFNNSSSKIIYPAEDIISKPNRFIANLLCNDKDENKIKEAIKNLGNALELTFFNEILTIFNNIIEKFTNNADIVRIQPQSVEYAKNQIKNFFEFYWLASVYNEDLDFGENYRSLENWLGAIKNRRRIYQTSGKEGEKGAKCILCGENNALFYYNKTRAFKHDFALVFNEYIRQIMDDGEGLCAICLIKRFLEELLKVGISRPRIPPINSTAGICLGNILHEEKFKSVFETYINLFMVGDKSYFDEDFYFRENISQKTLNEKIKSNYDKINKWFKDNKDVFKDTIWSKYYAIIMIDGDDMGKWLSGKFLKKDSDLESFHHKLSKKIGEFSKTLRELFEKHKGMVVYAGGDDNCGFVNLEHLFDLLNELKISFPHFEELDKNALINDDLKSTPSCGVCIAHYKEPLQRVINTAQQMEHEAKQVPNKNSVGIAILKHSGDLIKTVFKWNYLIELKEGGNTKINSIEILKKIFEKLNLDMISNTFFRTLGKEFWWLRTKNLKLSKQKLEEVNTVLSAELERLFYRSVLMNTSKNKIKKEDLLNKNNEYNKEILEPLKILLTFMNFPNFCAFLEICDFIKSKCMTFNQIQELY